MVRKGQSCGYIGLPKKKKSFEELKSRLCGELELWQMDLDRPYRLQCDASDCAIGAVLMQEFEGVWRPVSFFLENWEVAN